MSHGACRFFSVTIAHTFGSANNKNRRGRFGCACVCLLCFVVWLDASGAVDGKVDPGNKVAGWIGEEEARVSDVGSLTQAAHGDRGVELSELGGRHAVARFAASGELGESGHIREARDSTESANRLCLCLCRCFCVGTCQRGKLTEACCQRRDRPC